ncbi:hypothetical protein EVAR_18226_1 [Eumeta japonica]|uniref:Uncharacterized protein n=1 Tax=Eumeta variegata TaxID=151549 RepID=A0A4C1UJT7_EUMVA|nr:hypothetical protein EVAR_18226_1 [Eumeta japonica]
MLQRCDIRAITRQGLALCVYAAETTKGSMTETAIDPGKEKRQTEEGVPRNFAYRSPRRHEAYKKKTKWRIFLLCQSKTVIRQEYYTRLDLVISRPTSADNLNNGAPLQRPHDNDGERRQCTAQPLMVARDAPAAVA